MAVFNSTHAALGFAFNRASSQAPKSIMGAMIKTDRSGGEGSGLGGLDGIAQAAFIKARVERLGPLKSAVLCARYMSPYIMYGGGKIINSAWRAAVSTVMSHIRSELAMGDRGPAITTACVIRYYTPNDNRDTFIKMAEKIRYDRRTISEHYRKIALILGGARSGKRGLEAEAFDEIDAELTELGIVGSE